MKNIRVLIDADACPVLKEAARIASIRGFPVVLVGNDTQNLSRLASPNSVSIIEVPTGRDSADFALVSQVSPDDVVITDDIGLASIVLGRKARVISCRGHEFNNKTIDYELHFRHVGNKIRRSGGKTKGPAPFTAEDREKFVGVLKHILSELKNAGSKNQYQ